jgi:hypothetical protein
LPGIESGQIVCAVVHDGLETVENFRFEI